MRGDTLCSLPATPLSDAAGSLQTGSFASPPHSGFAFALAPSRTCKQTYFNVSGAADMGRPGRDREDRIKVNDLMQSEIDTVKQSLSIT